MFYFRGHFPIFQGDLEPIFTLLSSCKPMLQPFKHNVVWAFLAKKMAPSDSLVQRFLWKNRKNGIFEALFQQVNDSVQMRDMAHSICLIKLLSNNDEKKISIFCF